VHVYRISAAPGEVKSIKFVPSAPEPGIDHPSIAVLPFVNMSGDPDQEYFADGLTEDIITALSRFRDLLVISRNSSFVYKGKAVNVQEVAKAFAVQYVVEGRVRITVQLIDALTDRHIWADRYDRELSDIFATQDEVTSTIVATLPGRVEAAAHERVQRSPTSDMRAYECVLAAKVLHHRSRQEDNLEAQRLIDRAIELDPKYAHAHAWKACIVGQSWIYNWCPDRELAVQTVVGALNTALSLDENDSDVHRILAAGKGFRQSSRHDPVKQHRPRRIEFRDRAMRRVEKTRLRQSFGFSEGNCGRSPEIGKCRALGKPPRRIIEHCLQHAHGGALHQHIECPPSEHAHAPEMRQKGQRDHGMGVKMRQLSCIGARQGFVIAHEQSLQSTSIPRCAAECDRATKCDDSCTPFRACHGLRPVRA
jgi:TolB-like protein